MQILVRGSNANPVEPWAKYRPDMSAANPQGTQQPSATFNMHNFVRIRGGYVGALAPDDRDPTTYLTYLWGELQPSPNGISSEHIVSAISPTQGTPIDRSAVLDGFTVQGGAGPNAGAGIHMFNASPLIRDCTFQLNVGSEFGGHGGAIQSLGNANNPGPEIRNSTFRNNAAGGGSGGAVYLEQRGRIINCVFEDNVGALGGAVCASLIKDNTDGTAGIAIVNCRMQGNIARGEVFNGNPGQGGAVWASTNCLPQPGRLMITNSLLTNNTVAVYGGPENTAGAALYIQSGLDMNNCTVAYNGSNRTALHFVPACVCPPTDEAPHDVDNSIFWGNSGGSMYVEGCVGNAAIRNSDIDGGCPQGCTCTNVINTVPVFFGSGNYRLQYGSPCINAGDNSAVPLDTEDVNEANGTGEYTPDLDLHTRIVGSSGLYRVDMGAYEAQPTATCPADIVPIPYRDGTVNVNDLLEVINTWGPCPPAPAACYADITGDGQVNVNDLLAVINAWGPCPGYSGDPESMPQSIQDCMNAATNKAGLEPYSPEWNAWVNKCVQALCEAGIINCN